VVFNWIFLSDTFLYITDDLPDLTTLAAFSVTSEQGIAYGAGIWHHPMIALGSEPIDFAVVVYESSSELIMNCDEVFYDRSVATIEL
jgi:allantoicase